MKRNVLVTGGGTGIGKAVATAFASAGDSVVITGRRADRLRAAAEQIGPGVHSVVCDATDPEQVDALRARLPATLDVLVNCAGGIAGSYGANPAGLVELAELWRANLAANLLSAVLTTAAVDDRLAPGGTVVSLGSIAADQGSGHGYGAAKAALASWNVELAGRLGPRGLTANVVAPGYIADTELFGDAMTDQRRGQLVDNTSTGRAGTPADVAGTVTFLASPAARQLTGQVIALNGGARTTR